MNYKMKRINKTNHTIKQTNKQKNAVERTTHTHDIEIDEKKTIPMLW